VESDFPGFKFGITALGDIRKANGSNGFSYQSRAMNKTEGELFTFNAYSIKNKQGLVAVFVTTIDTLKLREKLGIKKPTHEDIDQNFKLDALILAEESYLDRMWGKQKIYDKESKPITWGNSAVASKE
jgi:hypothetical protein